MSDNVLLAVLIVVGSTEAKNFFDPKGSKKFTFNPVLAGFILGIFLYAIASAAPQISGKLNGLVIIGALILNGKPLFSALNTASYKKNKAAKTTKLV